MASDDPYVEAFLAPLRECLNFKPKFGRDEGVELTEFLRLYGDDPLYSRIGLATDAMYSAHKSGAGITSFYRQLGIACERLTRSVFMRELGLTDEDVRWSYAGAKADGKAKTLTLDARIPTDRISSMQRRTAVTDWISSASKAIKIEPHMAAALQGAVFEVRQGYKSADSKRQNADIDFALSAVKGGYVPGLIVFSGQASETVLNRYRREGVFVIFGSSAQHAHQTTESFFNEIVGWSLREWLDDHQGTLRPQVVEIVSHLLRP